MSERTVPPVANALEIAPEFALAAACCRWPPCDPNVLAAAATAVRDWSRFGVLVQRHRVAGAVAHAIEYRGLDIPRDARATIMAAARISVAQTMRNAAVELRVDDALRAAGIEPLFVKGASLSAHLYGSLTIKTCWDVDLVIAPAEMAATCATLRELGFHPLAMGQAVNGRAFLRHIAAAREVAWHDLNHGTVVEVHRTLVDDSAALTCATRPWRRQAVEISPGRTVETLRDDDLFAYLCVHGMTHGWARLKWLADVAALVARHGDPDALHRHASALGARRSASAALLLCEVLLGRKMPEGLRDRLTSDPVARRLAHRACALLDVADRRPGRYLTSLPESLRLIGVQASIVPGFAYKARYIGRLLTTPRWRFQLDLPAWLRLPALLTVGPWRFVQWIRRTGDQRLRPPAAS